MPVSSGDSFTVFITHPSNDLISHIAPLAAPVVAWYEYKRTGHTYSKTKYLGSFFQNRSFC